MPAKDRNFGVQDEEVEHTDAGASRGYKSEQD